MFEENFKNQEQINSILGVFSETRILRNRLKSCSERYNVENVWIIENILGYLKSGKNKALHALNRKVESTVENVKIPRKGCSYMM